MKFIENSLLLAVLSLAFATSAFASAEAPARALGPGASGGGKAVVRRTKSNKIRTVQLLDLWEAQEIHQLKILPAQGTVKQMVVRALKALSESVESDDKELRYYQDGKLIKTFKGPDAIFQELWHNAAQFFLPDDDTNRDASIRRMRNVHLEPTNDAFEAAVPVDRPIEQVVRFQDYTVIRGSVLVDQDLVDHMDAVNQAALIVHEALYKWLRDFTGEANSLRVRRAVGLAFSGHQFGALNKKFLPRQYWVCDAKGESSSEQPVSKMGGSRAFVLPVTFESEPNRVYATVQVSKLDGMLMIDSPPVLKDPSMGGAGLSGDDISNPSSLAGGQSHAENDGIVQPELKPMVRIDEAGPGHLAVSIGAQPSLFQPDGMKWQKATCVLKTNE